jgi:predicted RNA-binding protein with PIN domain
MSLLLIDGYNVIARGLAKNPTRDMGSDEAKRSYREELIRLSKRYCASKTGLEIRIYFDGTEESFAAELSNHAVKIFFTEGDQGADNAIIQFCRDYSRPREIEVATDDWHSLAFHIRSQVGKILSVAELMHRLDPGRLSSTSKTSSNNHKVNEEPPLSPGARQAINKTLPASWFR